MIFLNFTPKNIIMIGLIIIILAIIGFRILINLIKGKNRKRDIIKFVIYVVLILTIFLYGEYKYSTHINSIKEFDTIELCFEDCVQVNLTEQEKEILLDQLPGYTFYLDKTYNYGFEEANDGHFKSMTATILIDDTNLIFTYSNNISMETGRYEEFYVIVYNKNGTYYSKIGKNPVSEIFKKYVELYESDLR